MRIVAVVLALAPLVALASLASLALSVPLTLVSCESSSSPTAADASFTTISTEDGATCGCASPDCLPNCSNLPACKITCVSGPDETVLDWVDPCGTIQYTQACANGCTDAGPPACK